MNPVPAHIQALTDANTVNAHQVADREVWQHAMTIIDMPQAQYLAVRDFHEEQGTTGLWSFTASNEDVIADCQFLDVKLDWTPPVTTRPVSIPVCIDSGLQPMALTCGLSA